MNDEIRGFKPWFTMCIKGLEYATNHEESISRYQNKWMYDDGCTRREIHPPKWEDIENDRPYTIKYVKDGICLETKLGRRKDSFVNE